MHIELDAIEEHLASGDFRVPRRLLSTPGNGQGDLYFDCTFVFLCELILRVLLVSGQSGQSDRYIVGDLLKNPSSELCGSEACIKTTKLKRRPHNKYSIDYSRLVNIYYCSNQLVVPTNYVHV